MSEANAVNACILTDLCPLMPAIERSGSDAISNGKAPITGNAGALARNEREARNDYLAEVLSRSEKILCAYEAVRARAPAFPVIRSDYRNCISTSGPVLIRSTTSRPTQIGCRIVEAIRRAHFAAEDADDSSALVTPYLAEEHETAGAYVLSPVTLFRGISGRLRKTVEVLLQWILRHEQINPRTLQHVLYTLALVAEGRRKVEHHPSIVHALLDFARRTTAALIFGNESR